MKHLESIINSGLLNEISKNDYINAFEQLRVTGRTYKKNEYIFFEGDVIDKICIIEEGSVRGEKTYPNGELHIVDVFEKGTMFALAVAVSRTKVAAVDYVSNDDTTVVFVSMHSIERSSYAHEMRRTFAYLLADDNIRMAHKIEILAERGLRDRIIAYLGVLQGKSGKKEVTVLMNREQMAQYLCVNRSALSNELNKMKREGIIDFKGSKFELKSC